MTYSDSIAGPLTDKKRFALYDGILALMSASTRDAFALHTPRNSCLQWNEHSFDVTYAAMMAMQSHMLPVFLDDADFAAELSAEVKKTPSKFLQLSETLWGYPAKYPELFQSLCIMICCGLAMHPMRIKLSDWLVLSVSTSAEQEPDEPDGSSALWSSDYCWMDRFGNLRGGFIEHRRKELLAQYKSHLLEVMPSTPTILINGYTVPRLSIVLYMVMFEKTAVFETSRDIHASMCRNLKLRLAQAALRPEVDAVFVCAEPIMNQRYEPRVRFYLLTADEWLKIAANPDGMEAAAIALLGR